MSEFYIPPGWFYLCTAITEVKSLGLPTTKLVKMNSNLVLLDLVKM